MDKKETIEHLNTLLTRAYDVEEGFQKASERAQNHPQLAAFFAQQSASRHSFGQEIKGLIAKYGGEPDKGSSVVAKAHQIWITIQDTLTSDANAESILAECVRGEKVALAEYDTLLTLVGLPADVLELAMSQRIVIAQSLETVQQQEALAS